MNKSVLIGGGAVIFAALAIIWWSSTYPDRGTELGNKSATPVSDSVIIPKLSKIALSGEIAFNKNCAVCHGKNATGTDQGPPLIHKFYSSKRHADFSFVIAAKSGVRAHHWRFGSMPPVEGITDEEIQSVIKYIREIQVVNGI